MKWVTARTNRIFFERLWNILPLIAVLQSFLKMHFMPFKLQKQMDFVLWPYLIPVKSDRMKSVL